MLRIHKPALKLTLLYRVDDEAFKHGDKTNCLLEKLIFRQALWFCPASLCLGTNKNPPELLYPAAV